MVFFNISTAYNTILKISVKNAFNNHCASDTRVWFEKKTFWKKEHQKVWSLGLAEFCSKVQYFWWIWEEYSSNTVQDLKMDFKKTKNVIFFFLKQTRVSIFGGLCWCCPPSVSMSKHQHRLERFIPTELLTFKSSNTSELLK